MKAEIGFARDADWRLTDRLRLVVTAQSETEGSALTMFAKRAGLFYDETSGTMAIEETTVRAAPSVGQSDSLAKAAAGGSFWDSVERSADRVAEHQRSHAAGSGWTGDSWVACGCAAPGVCPKATCTNHRMAGIRYVWPRPAGPPP